MVWIERIETLHDTPETRPQQVAGSLSSTVRLLHSQARMPEMGRGFGARKSRINADKYAHTLLADYEYRTRGSTRLYSTSTTKLITM